MEYLIGIIVALFAGVLYFKGKADKAAAGSRIIQTKSRDRELAERQTEVEQAIKDLDDGIRKMNEQKAKEEKSHKNMTLKERADAARNRYKK